MVSRQISITLSTCDGPESLRSLCRGEHSDFCSILQHDWYSESVMFWGGLVRGDLSAVRFQDERLRPITRLHAAPLSLGFHLVHDNARLDVCQQVLDEEDVNATDWPSHSQDLSSTVGHHLLLHSPSPCLTGECLSHHLGGFVFCLGTSCFILKSISLVSDHLLFLPL